MKALGNVILINLLLYFFVEARNIMNDLWANQTILTKISPKYNSFLLIIIFYNNDVDSNNVDFNKN